MDAWRIGMAFLGIVYHCLGAEIHGRQLTEWAFVVHVIHSFRMEAFFALAGMMTAPRTMRQGYPVSRVRVILIPFATIWLIVSAQRMGEGGGVLTGASAHLWFLICLAQLTFGLILADRLNLLASFARNDRWRGIALALLISAYAGRVAVARIAAEWPGDHDLLITFILSLQYLPFFLLGVLVARNTACRTALTSTRWSWMVGPLAVAVVAAFYSAERGWVRAAGANGTLEDMLLVTAALGCTWTIIATSVASRIALGPAGRWLADASYAIYLLHYLPIRILHEALAPVAPGIRVLLLILASFSASLLGYWIIRRSPWLATLFTGARFPAWKTVPVRQQLWRRLPA